VRPRVLDSLDRASIARVVVVSASAGSGKSLALSQWVRYRSPSAHWCTLDPADNDSTRFWRHVLGSSELADLAPRSLGRVTLRRASEFVDELLDGIERRPSLPTIVLDGFDVISDPVVLASFDEVLARAPDTARFVVVGRARPHLAGLARLRARDEVRTVGYEDLRFDADDAAQLMTMLDTPLDPLQLELLMQRTEGWAAGVQFAGLQLRESNNADAVLDDFGGDTPDVANYLSSEVLDHLDEETHRFLLESSVTDTLTAGVCSELTGRDDSAMVLRELDRRGLFVHPIDDDPSTFRFHPLMRERLEAELERSSPATHRALHRTAAQWCESQGDDDGAVRHFVRAGDTQAAFDRFAESMVSQFYQGRYATIASWTRLLSRTRDFEPAHGVALAIAMVYLGQIDEAQRVLGRAKASVGPTDGLPPLYVAWQTYADYAVAYARGDLLAAARLGSDAHRMIDGARPGAWQRSRAPLGRVTLLSLLGRFDRARAVHEEFRQNLLAPLLGDEVLLDGTLSEVELVEGNLGEAARLAARGAEREAAAGADFGYEVHYVLGSVQTERNELDAAVGTLRRAVDRGDRVGWSHSRVLPRLALARAYHVRGERLRAHELVIAARECLVGDARVLEQRIIEVEALLALAEGDSAAALRVADGLVDPCRTRVRARIHAVDGDRARALSALNGVGHTTTRDRLDALLIRARCAPTDDQRDELTREALALAEPHRYVRVFAEESRWIQPVLTRIVGAWPSRYPVDLLAVLAAEPLNLRMVAGGTGLTPREQEVLRYLGTPMSMSEIARALFVSRNTVKSHVRNIYGKLGVRTRREAVALHRQGTETAWPV
jgi:LuxR family maltose regulon positive regulatory protein